MPASCQPGRVTEQRDLRRQPSPWRPSPSQGTGTSIHASPAGWQAREQGARCHCLNPWFGVTSIRKPGGGAGMG